MFAAVCQLQQRDQTQSRRHGANPPGAPWDSTTGGAGQHLDIALYDAQVHAASHVAMNYLSSGRVPARNGTASQITCPWQVFDAASQVSSRLSRS